MGAAERWDQMLVLLAGGKPPELPLLPGRVHRMPPPTERDMRAEAWEQEHGRWVDPNPGRSPWWPE